MNLENVRNQFDSPKQGLIYLNHAGVSPLPRCSAEIMHQVVDWNRHLTSNNWNKMMGTLKVTRNQIALMLNADAQDIALTRNTTEGLNWVASGMNWRPGDQVVSVQGEYPANVYPWMRLQKKGVTHTMIQPQGGEVSLESIKQALTEKTRLLTLSFVEFSTGYRFDLGAVGELCQQRGIFFLVDLIQGMGVFPLDLPKWNITFASGGAQKWLLGPQGAGFFYCPKKHLEHLEVTSVGATSVAHPLPYTEYDFTLKENAARFEYGTPSTLPLAGMGASVQMLNQAGMSAVRDQIHALTNILIHGALQKGYRCHSPRQGETWSGIVTLTHPLHSPDAVVNQLRGKNIIGIEREGRIRLTPHFYQTEEEMKHVVEAL